MECAIAWIRVPSLCSFACSERCVRVSGLSGRRPSMKPPPYCIVDLCGDLDRFQAVGRNGFLGAYLVSPAAGGGVYQAEGHEDLDQDDGGEDKVVGRQ